jgi:hypothetical protein
MGLCGHREYAEATNLREHDGKIRASITSIHSILDVRALNEDVKGAS